MPYLSANLQGYRLLADAVPIQEATLRAAVVAAILTVAAYKTKLASHLFYLVLC